MMKNSSMAYNVLSHKENEVGIYRVKGTILADN